MGSEEMTKKILTISRTHTTPRVHVEMGNGSDVKCDDLNDSQINKYKELSYKLFQFRTYKLRGSNGDFGCPFCDYRVDHPQCQNVDLLLHAIRVGESSESGKQRANHLAMPKYLGIDLADDVKEEAARLSLSEDGKRLKRLRLDENSSMGETDAIDKVLHLERELNEKEKSLKSLLKQNEDLEHSNQNLLAREQKSNAELQMLRKILMKGLDDRQSGKKSGIGIKHMGEIDVDVFKRVYSKIRPNEVEIGGEALCTAWQDLVENPEWHPFRMVEDDKGNLEMVVVEDESLRRLKHNWGEEIYSEVVRALKDICEYNPRRRRTVAEIWNFNENRKANLEEVITYVLAQSKQ